LIPRQWVAIDADDGLVGIAKSHSELRRGIEHPRRSLFEVLRMVPKKQGRSTLNLYVTTVDETSYRMGDEAEVLTLPEDDKLISLE
jgi:reverse gyrase